MYPLVREIIRLETRKARPCDIEVVYHRATEEADKLKTADEGRLSVLFLPFWGGSARTFRHLQAHLAEKLPRLTTIAISYPGTGRSSRDTPSFDADGIAQNTPINNFALMIKSLIPKLDNQLDLIDYKAGLILAGHSMGAKIASAVLVSGLNLQIKALMLLAPASPRPWPMTQNDREARLKSYDTVEIAKHVIRKNLTLRHPSDEMLSELAKDAASMTGDAKCHWIKFGIDEDITPQLDAADTVTKTTRIRIFSGVRDEVETWARVNMVIKPTFTDRGFGDVEVIEVANCGHLLPVEDEGVIKVTQELVKLLEE